MNGRNLDDGAAWRHQPVKPLRGWQPRDGPGALYPAAHVAHPLQMGAEGGHVHRARAVERPQPLLVEADLATEEAGGP